MRHVLSTAALLCAVCLTADAQDDPWADAVVDFDLIEPNSGYDTPNEAVGAPSGGGASVADNSSLVSLGRPFSYVILQFDTPVTDDPANPMGLDCIVYSNAIWVGGNPALTWQEPALIEISRDANGNGQPDDPWYMIPGSRGYDYDPYPSRTEPDGTTNDDEPDLMAGRIRNPNTLDEDDGNDEDEYDWGYAELTPGMRPYRDNYVRPDDPLETHIDFGTGGGDAFDIADAVPEEEGLPPLTEFDFIKLTAFIDRNTGALGYATPEIDAVADVAPEVDADGDGVLDEYETRVAGTDPHRPENTVLPLEIPPLWGGSPSGTLLGTAEAPDGARLRLYSAGERDFAPKNYNVVVDITALTEPGGELPADNLLKSGAVREFSASGASFLDAGIEPAELRIPYSAAEIDGLDEPSLAPYRHTDSGYTQEGIASIAVNRAANFVTFRSDRLGVFLLAAPEGDGDDEAAAAEDPAGDITLHASPAGEVVANPANEIAVTSDPIRDGNGEVVADGALITVEATAGTVTASDVDGGLPGNQVSTSGGVISFRVEAPETAGSARFTATSVEGTAYGELAYVFAPGPPAPPVPMMTGEAEGSGPFTVEISVGPAEDQFGNVVRDGTLLTVVVDSGNVVSGDADSDLAGHQIVLTNGRGGFYVEIPTADTEFVAVLYADAEMETELGAANYSGPPPMPLGGVCVLAALLGILGAWMCRGKALAPARGRRAGFTLVELLVVIGIIGVLAAILLPALSRARQMAYQTQCLSNLKQLYMANTMYASEWNGRYAPAAPDIEVGYGGTIRWHGVRERPFPDSEFDPNRGPLAEYLPDARIKQCPSFLQFSKKGDVDNAFESSTGGYGYNMAYIGGTSYSSSWPQNAKRTTRDSRVHDPSSVIMFADAAMPQIDANGSHYLVEYSFVEPPLFPTPSHPHGNPDWGYAAPSIHFRHNGRANVLWADGHATSEKWEWAEPRTNIFGGDNYRWGVGWFGPKDNSLFDVLPEDDYGFLFNAR